MASASDDGDPWDWGIDRVARELCTDQRSWTLPTPTSLLPDPVALEKSLREQELNGFTLLCHTSDRVLKDDLGIASIGRRATIQDGIRQLRRQSQKYQQRSQQDRQQDQQSLAALARLLISQHGPMFQSAQVQLSPGHLLDNQAHQPSPVQAPTPVTPTQTASDPNHMAMVLYGQESRPDDEPVPSDAWAAGENGHKRRRLDLSALQTRPLGYRSPSPVDVDEARGATDGPVSMNISSAPNSPDDDSSKKRKRIQPTFVRHLPAGRSNTVQPAPTPTTAEASDTPSSVEPEPTPTDDIGGPGTVDQGAPLPQDLHEQQVSSDAQIAAESPPQNSATAKRLPPVNARTKSVGYLGRNRLTVDEVFYGKSAIGEILKDDPKDPNDENVEYVDRSLNEGPRTIPVGRRLYVAKLMKRFLRQPRRTFKRGDKLYTAITPYPPRLVPRTHAPSFTLYQILDDGKVQATREDITKWPEAEESTEKTTVQGLGDPSSYELMDFERDLAHWKDKPSELLPVFGESGSENELSTDAWNDYIKEHGHPDENVPIKNGPTRKRPALSASEIEAAIDERIAKFKAEWTAKRLPMLRNQAHRIWCKAVRDRNRKELVKRHQADLAHLDNKRIPELREKITGSLKTLRKAQDVYRLCKGMQPSIENREELAFRITLLGSKKEPPKPERKAARVAKKAAILAKEGDGESLDDVSDDDDGGLTDFIASDEELESSSADDERDDDSDTPMYDSLSPSHVNDQEMADAPSQVDSPSMVRTDDRSDAESQIPLSLPRPKSTTPPVGRNAASSTQIAPVIDLTNTSSDAEYHTPASVAAGTSAENPIEVYTPEKKRSGSPIDFLTPKKDSNDEKSSPSRGKSRIRLTIKSPASPKTNLKLYSSSASAPGTSTSSPLSQTVKSADEHPVPDPLPDLSDLDAILKVKYKTWESIEDRERLVARVFHRMSKDAERFSLLELAQDIKPVQLWQKVMDVAKAGLEGVARLPSIDQDAASALKGLGRIFEMWIDCKHYLPRPKTSPEFVAKLGKNQNEFVAFHALCQSLLDIYTQRSKSGFSDEDDEDDEEPRSANRRAAQRGGNGSASNDNASNGEADADEPVQPPSSRKVVQRRRVVQDKEAMSQRQREKARAEEHEQRVKSNKKAIEADNLNVAAGRKIINEGKQEEHGFVYLNDNIAKQAKDHQTKGIRFMWQQIIEDRQQQQGCLLAHTMGLGKTMQTISFLVTVAETKASEDKTISSLIPDDLLQSRTLILCPPALVNNWYEELVYWAPDKLLGEYFTITATMKHDEDRLATVDDWYTRGGILLIGYSMFRAIMNNNKRSPEQQKQLEEQLIGGPNLIIADEAHYLKTAKSQLTELALKFPCKRRIALTGSPLANSVAEYYAMISWISPNFLGPPKDFNANFVLPIQDGLYTDSTPAQRRRSLKRLTAVKNMISPKVNRADMAVLTGMPTKTEFVITVPLTPFQTDLYRLYVRFAKSNTGEDDVAKSTGQLRHALLWKWLAVLKLICNHPQCFIDRILKKSDTRDDMEEVPQDSSLEEKTRAVLERYGPDSGAARHSHKVLILLDILEASRVAGDRVLIFSHSIPTLDFLETALTSTGREFYRLDGTTKIGGRQETTKEFNKGSIGIYLISTKAGGVGINLQGANRVVLFDFDWNPTHEEQAVGRAYRIGQKKSCYVYKFVTGGTWEAKMHNQAVFKTQLASQVVDNENPQACAKRNYGEYLKEPEEVKQKDLAPFKGKDPDVLDGIIASQEKERTIHELDLTDSFRKPDEDVFEPSPEERKEIEEDRLLITDPAEWHRVRAAREAEQKAQEQAQFRAQQEQGRQEVLGLQQRVETAPPTRPAVPSPDQIPPASSATRLQVAPQPNPVRQGPEYSSGNTSPVLTGNAKSGQPVQASVSQSSAAQTAVAQDEQASSKCPQTPPDRANITPKRKSPGNSTTLRDRLYEVIAPCVLPPPDFRGYGAKQFRTLKICNLIVGRMEDRLGTGLPKSAPDKLLSHLQGDKPLCEMLVSGKTSPESFVASILGPLPVSSAVKNRTNTETSLPEGASAKSVNKAQSTEPRSNSPVPASQHRPSTKKGTTKVLAEARDGEDVSSPARVGMPPPKPSTRPSTPVPSSDAPEAPANSTSLVNTVMNGWKGIGSALGLSPK